ncbi:hypothetical protein RHS04_06112 [Rhizoctonia solani]|uniref:Uncharacterized protein n=1 Tax=Rhizoctonia solani TaxID=456999 RepID=A0A8H7H818_9AGAM|nr:hypothetical protein RHS04_06112 [Rhizoctonia solani]
MPLLLPYNGCFRNDHNNLAIVFICRTRTGLREHDGIFNAIWKITWASAAPPLILLTVSIINGYIIQSGSQPLNVIVGGINAKFCNLSLMVNLLGQDFIRRRFERDRSPELPTIQTSEIDRISDPAFAIPMPNLGTENTLGMIADPAGYIRSHDSTLGIEHGEDSDVS